MSYRPGAQAGIAQSVDTVDADDFALLARPLAATDSVPSVETEGLTASTFSGTAGANLALARQAEGFDRGGAWVVPGNGGLCLIADPTYTVGATSPTGLTGGAECVDDAAAAAGEIVLTSPPNRKDPGHYEIAGLVPNGVATVALTLSDGTMQSVAVHDNVYMAAPTISVTGVSFTRPSGQETVEPLRAPAASGG